METNSWACYMFDRMEEETKSKFVRVFKTTQISFVIWAIARLRYETGIRKWTTELNNKNN